MYPVSFEKEETKDFILVKKDDKLMRRKVKREGSREELGSRGSRDNKSHKHIPLRLLADID